MFKWLGKLVGDPNAKVVRKLQPLVDAVNGLEPQIQALSDEGLRAKTDELRARFAELTKDERQELDDDYANKNLHDSTVEKEYQKELRAIEDAALDELLPEAFALVREASRRVLGQRHYDVQLIGGIVLHQGKISEMKTGEGKTLVASLPIFLNALGGRGVHLITVNDYLARVGGGWMAPIYHFLGMSVGYVAHDVSSLYDPNYVDPNAKQDDSRLLHWRPCKRQEAYAADITYGTNNEFGFDYLRDNMVQDRRQRVQRELHYAIIDEVDNILIDEARTPLIISGPAQESSSEYARFAGLVRGLKRSTVSPDDVRKGVAEDYDGDYWIDEKSRAITLTELGLEEIERRLKLPEGETIYDAKNYQLTHYLENALKAEYVFHRDRDYVVQADGEVVIVDEFTGRTMAGRRWSDGLHQAVEAKEGVEVRRENVTLATITFQNYFRMYHKLGGMTGTALTEAEEFNKIYELEVVPIPTNKPVIREDLQDQIYVNERAKYNALLKEIQELHALGRPILVGTTSIESSEHISRMLTENHLPHYLLNAKQHEREAYIVAQAGRLGAITIATNMAGRGTDILLGGNPDGLIEEKLRDKGLTFAEATPEQIAEAQGAAVADVAEQRAKVIKLGGLHIIGTERHEARRIDNQLRGRAGRQGDPGSSRFFLSLEDDLMKRFGRMETVQKWMGRLGNEDDPIEAGLLSKAIESAQTRVEGYNFDIRKHVVEYDDVVNKQREVIYADRRAILDGEDMGERIVAMIEDEIAGHVEDYLDNPELDGPDIEGFLRQVFSMVPRLEVARPDLAQELRGKQPEKAEELVLAAVREAYDGQGEELASQYGELLKHGVRIQGIDDPEEIFPHFERQVMLQAIDRQWIDYLTAIDEMRQGIGNVALAQQDPLVAFKRKAFGMFDELKDNIRRAIVYDFFKAADNWQVSLKRVEMEAQARLESAQVAGGSSNATEADEQPKAGAKSGSAKRSSAQQQRPQQRRAAVKVGRNEACPCGSGKKFKYCHEGNEKELEIIIAAKAQTAAAEVGGAKKSRGRNVSSR